MRQASDSNAETSTGRAVKVAIADLPALPEVGDAGLRDRLVDLEQARNMIEAEQARVMADMHQRAATADAARDAALAPQARALVPAHDSRLVEFVADEIGALLACTRMLASHRLDAALEITGRHAVTTTWATGSIDYRKAALIARGVREVDPVFADVLAAQACEYAITHTAPQTKSWLDRRVLTADPSAAEVNRTRASAGRKITLTPLADGMAELSALLPGVQARQAYDTINALAHRTNDTNDAAEESLTTHREPHKDARTMDQRRADALMDLVTGRAEPPQVNIQVVVPADTLTGKADLPADIPGLGPITGHEVRRLAFGSGPDQVSYRPLVVDPETGTMPIPTAPVSSAGVDRYRPPAGLDRAVRARDLTCRFPGCRRRAMGHASGTDLDHTVPWPAGPTAWQNLAVLCRHHHRLKHAAGWTVDLTPDAVMTWTTPAGRTFTTYPWHYIDPPDTS